MQALNQFITNNLKEDDMIKKLSLTITAVFLVLLISTLAAADVPECAPWIDSSELGMQPRRGSPGAVVTLRGGCFGDEHTMERSVKLKKKLDGTEWIKVPIHAWTDTLIEWQLPAWAFVVGRYRVKVFTEMGTSNIPSSRLVEMGDS
jgi:hypothetical protein